MTGAGDGFLASPACPEAAEKSRRSSGSGSRRTDATSGSKVRLPVESSVCGCNQERSQPGSLPHPVKIPFSTTASAGFPSLTVGSESGILHLSHLRLLASQPRTTAEEKLPALPAVEMRSAGVPTLPTPSPSRSSGFTGGETNPGGHGAAGDGAVKKRLKSLPASPRRRH